MLGVGHAPAIENALVRKDAYLHQQIPLQHLAQCATHFEEYEAHRVRIIPRAHVLALGAVLMHSIVFRRSIHLLRVMASRKQLLALPRLSLARQTRDLVRRTSSLDCTLVVHLALARHCWGVGRDASVYGAGGLKTRLFPIAGASENAAHAPHVIAEDPSVIRQRHARAELRELLRRTANKVRIQRRAAPAIHGAVATGMFEQITIRISLLVTVLLSLLCVPVGHILIIIIPMIPLLSKVQMVVAGNVHLQRLPMENMHTQLVELPLLNRSVVITIHAASAHCKLRATLLLSRAAHVKSYAMSF